LDNESAHDLTPNELAANRTMSPARRMPTSDLGRPLIVSALAGGHHRRIMREQ
jgi:hypothetical protein